MIRFIRQFHRRNFCHSAKAELLDIFEGDTSISRAIILQESFALPGVRITYLWLEFPKSCHQMVSEVDRKKKGMRAVIERSLPKSHFAAVFQQIETSAFLGNFSGKVKDGVFYSLCWGDRFNLRMLSIKNPQFGSQKHLELVLNLKKTAENVGAS